LALLSLLALFFFLAVNPPLRAEEPQPAAANQTTGQIPDNTNETNVAPPEADPAASEAASPEAPTVAIDPEILKTPVNDDFLRQIWESRASGVYQMVVEISNSVDAIIGAHTLSDRLASANLELTRLMRLFQISRAYPAQQEDLLRQMQGLRVIIGHELESAEIQKNLLTQRKEEIASLKKDMEGLVFDDKSSALPKKSLEMAEELLTRADQRLESVLGPGRILLKNLDSAIASIEKDIPTTWRNYYLTSAASGGQVLGGLTSSVDQIFSWAKSLASMTLFIWPQTAANWLGALVRFLVALGVTALLGELIRRAFKGSKLAWKEGIAKIIQGSWLWLIVGLSLLIGSRNSLGGSYLALKLPGVLILLWGLASLSWRLRVAALPKLEGHSSPLARFFPPAGLGVVFLFLDCPAGPMTVGWLMVLILFLIWRKRSKVAPTGEKLTFMETLSYSSAVYFAIGSLLTTILGYPRLAILLFMLLFTLVNIMILAAALISLGATLSDFYFDEKESPIKRAISRSLAIPLAFVLSLVAAVPWLWSTPGLEYLLLNFLKQGYTIGDASFEFSRILLIVFLFFLFRSLVAFGQTTLEELPRTFTGLEKGVIPPLKVLVTYLIWVIYAIIALGLLGVNFTSLAVVAGGLSVGVGLGLQAIFGNLVSGLILMFGRTIMVGDLVEVNGVLGTVKSVNIRSTELETAEKAVVYVPNSNIMSGQFTNWTRNHRQVRRKLIVQTVYGVDIALALTAMKEIALAHEKVMAADPPAAFLSEFGDNSLIFTLLVTIVDVDFGLSTLSAIRQAIERRFQELGITLYNPCLEVTLLTPKPIPDLAK
jgi:small-conductance mechanosensitive channel